MFAQDVLQLGGWYSVNDLNSDVDILGVIWFMWI